MWYFRLSASLVVAVLTYSTILTAIDFALIGEVSHLLENAATAVW